jgi:hypothetical protein
MENQALQTQNNSQTLLKELEAQEKGYSLKPSLAIAMERIDMEIKNIDNTIDDICTEFPFFMLSDIKEAIRLGSLGMYGRTYRLSTQEICFWIRQYQKQKMELIRPFLDSI